MKNLKKVLALVMAFAMAFTMMAGAAYTDQDDIQATDAVELLATLNVMTGKGDGMFHPNDTITRAEICRIIYTIRNEGNDNANAYADMQTSFQDLTSADDWAKGYIKHCQSVNLISGRDAAGTIFGPQDPVTGVELAVICLRVLGYDPAKAGIGGESWSTKTIGLASEAGLLKGVNMESVTGPCERQWAAQIMANMLDARTVRWSNDGDRYTIYGEDNQENKKVGREYMKLHSSIGTLIGVDGGNLSITQNSSDRADSDGAMLTNFTNVKTDYTELLGQKVNVLYSDGKANSVIGVYALSDNTVYTVNASAVESDGDKVKFDGKSYSIESYAGNNTINTYYTGIDGDKTAASFTAQTGVKYTGSSSEEKDAAGRILRTYYVFSAKQLFDDWDGSSAIMKFVDSDDNGRLDSVIITDYAAAEVTSATSTRIVAGKSYNFSDENIDEGIAQDDWVSISWNRFDDCRDIKKLDVTTGKLDGLKENSKTENDRYTFNEYRVDSAWFNDAKDVNGYADLNTVRAGDNIEYILVNGVAWMVKRAGEGSLDNVVDVAMVVRKDNGEGVNGRQVKLQFFNDTTAIVDVDTYSTSSSTNRVSYEDLVAGKLYEYSISGGKYIFETLKNGKPANSSYKDFYGDYTYMGDTYSYTFGSNNDKIDTGANIKTIDDRAKVILYAGNASRGDSDVITGKQLKNLTSSMVGGASASNVEYFTADVNGLNRAAALAINVGTLPTGMITNDYYGYILSDAIQTNRSNEISYDLLLETGDTVTVYERSARVNARKANTLIGYGTLAEADSNGNRYIDDVTLYTLTDVPGAEHDNFGIGAVSSVNTNQSAIEIQAYGRRYGDNTTAKFQSVDRDITSDTVIFYVDTDDKTGATTGTIRTAIDWSGRTSNDFAKIGDKVANCLYLDKDGEDLEVLVIENGDRQFRGPETDEFVRVNGTGGSTGGGTTGANNVNATTSNVNITDNNLLRGTVTITRPDWMTADATVTVPYTIKNDSNATVATGSFNMTGNTYNLADENTKLAGKLSANENITFEFGKATASKVKVRYFANGSTTPLTVGANADLASATDTVAANDAISVTAGNWQKGLKDVTATTITIAGGTMTTKTGSFVFTDVSGAAQAVTLSAANNLTAIDGDDYLDITFGATTDNGRVVSANPTAEEITEAFKDTDTVSAPSIAADTTVTVPAGKTLAVTGAIDPTAKFVGGGTIDADTDIPTQAVVAETSVPTITNGAATVEVGKPNAIVAEGNTVKSTFAVPGNANFEFMSVIDTELAVGSKHFSGASTARIVKIALPGAKADTEFKIDVTGNFGNKPSLPQATGVDSLIDYVEDGVGYTFVTVDNLTGQMQFTYTPEGGTEQVVTVNFDW